MLRAIDLFCGAGGMSEGVIQSGFHILFSSDLSPDVQKTYMNRHEQLGLIQGDNTYFHCGDVKELSGKFIFDKISKLSMFKRNEFDNKIDVIFGGPPCQGFSRAGKRKSDDPRNLLFKEYLRIINEIQPKYVVMENVQGFNDTKFFDFIGLTGEKYSDGTLAPDILLNEFNLINYNVLKPQVLDASDYGVPQKRKRAIFIAYRKGEIKPKYPKPLYKDDEKITIDQAIGDLNKEKNKYILTDYQKKSREGRTPNVNGITIKKDSELQNTETSLHQPIIKERFSLYKEGEDTSNVRKRLLKTGLDLNDKPALLEYCSKNLNAHKDKIIYEYKNNISNDLLDIILTKKSIRTRLNRKKQSLTVVTLPDDYISPYENRTLSVRELARLQSFDDSFVFLSKRTTGGPRRKIEVPQYTQVGNAVPPLLAKAVSNEIKIVLEIKKD